MKEIILAVKINNYFEEIEISKNQKETYKKIKDNLMYAIEQMREYDNEFCNECIEELKQYE